MGVNTYGRQYWCIKTIRNIYLTKRQMAHGPEISLFPSINIRFFGSLDVFSFILSTVENTSTNPEVRWYSLKRLQFEE